MVDNLVSAAPIPKYHGQWIVEWRIFVLLAKRKLIAMRMEMRCFLSLFVALLSPSSRERHMRSLWTEIEINMPTTLAEPR